MKNRIANIWSKGKGLFLELFIVFLGVYLAFQLNNCKQNSEADKLKKNYYSIILNEFKVNLQEISLAKTEVSNYLDQFTSAIENKETPQIKSLNSIQLNNNMLVLKAAFENGHLANLKPEYISNLSLGSNLLTRISKQLENYNTSVNDALSLNNWDNSNFYASDLNLKQKYNWIVDDLQFILKYLTGLEEAIKYGAIPDTENLINLK